MRVMIWFLMSGLLFGTFAAEVGAAQEKVLVYHLSAPPDLLDPVKCNNIRCQRVMWPIYEPLVNLSKDSRTAVQGLAESWEVSLDGLTYTFHLRKGVTFHDGTPFTAEAVKINLERHFLKGSPFYTADPPNVREKVLGGLIKDIVVRDAHNLVIILKNQKLHLLFLAPMVSPAALAKYGTKVGQHPVGTGPFKFSRWTTQEVLLEAHRDYWGGRPKLDRVVFQILSQPEKAMQEFLAGKIDFIPEVEPTYVERIIASPSTRLIRVPTLSIFYLGFYTDRKPFQDPRVRKAITKAVDIERAILFISRGMGVAAYGPIPPGADAYEPELARPRYDPEEARRLLREAGYTSGLRMSLLFSAHWGFLSELAQAIKTDLGKIGVTVDLVEMPGWKELVAEARKGVGDAFTYVWYSFFTDPEIFLLPNFQTGSVDNLTRYSNPKVDSLLKEAQAPIVPMARIELYRQAQRMIVEDAPIVPLFHEVRVSAYNTRVTGLELNIHSLPVDRFARVDISGESGP
ncbi:MAG TPA: ABC transporter substrate-binding protein [Candidatus Methylomirabilis sp.]|nr:ABC transporter substrate-binding protein [Candidatus Methylomirabilis sp.]